jgi:four helix bundle protein
MNFDTWLSSVPGILTGDPLWKVEAYRLALFVSDIGWHDVSKLARDKRTLDISNQLYRALGSVGANLSEGYSRGGGRDRVRFYEYALGSARESRGWYFNSRFVLSEPVSEHRMGLLTQIVRLLLTMIPEQRDVSLREEPVPYRVDFDATEPFDRERLQTLIQNIPMP